MGYVLGHVALDDGRARLPCINSLRIRLCTICRISGVVICQLTSARFPRRDSALPRDRGRSVPGHLRSRDTPGGIFQPAVHRPSRCPRAASQLPRASRQSTINVRWHVSTSHVASPAASDFALRFYFGAPTNPVKQRAPETTARRRGMGWGGWEASPRQKCFRPDDKQNENRRNTQAVSGVRFIARHLRARRKSMDTIRTLKNFSFCRREKFLTGKCRNHEVALGLMK